MRLVRLLALLGVALVVTACRPGQDTAAQGSKPGQPDLRSFRVRGVITELKADGRTVVIKHEAIADYMPAMTMPFKVKSPQELAGLQAGDEVTFRLQVAPDQSWIDQLAKTGKTSPVATPSPSTTQTNSAPTLKITDIPDFALTNELDQPVHWRGFKGKAVALTFFFTRCPIPEYCPRLSKNFEQATARLKAMTNGPRNYHFLSVSFDPLDTPAILRAYAKHYNYDSNHWSLVTGDPEHIRQLTRGFGLTVTNDGAFYSHDFRTIIFDANGRFQTLWPFGGNTTEMLVKEMLKATAATNQAATTP